MTMRELWAKVNNEHADIFFNLWERWKDEHEYEDINEYLKHIQKSIPEAYAITKRPFGIKVKCEDGNAHFTVKRQGNYLKLFAQKC